MFYCFVGLFAYGGWFQKLVDTVLGLMVFNDLEVVSDNLQIEAMLVDS